jgi:tripartite-type tricarboxylate transporter receptor subunit TctC
MAVYVLAALFTVFAVLVPARAADYPAPGKTISIIVPYAPGGGTDTTARLMAAGLTKELGVNVQVVNREGAASQVGLTELVRSRPDGYTLAYAVLPTVVTHYLDPKRQAIYTRASFQPIAIHNRTAMMLAVPSDGPYKSLHDLVEAARKSPGAIKVSDSGLLGTPHVETLMLGLVAGVKFTSVHFGGGAPSVTALLGNHVDVLAGGTSDALPQLLAGKFNVLGVATEEPDPSMPQIPTMRAQGYDVVVSSMAGIVAPAGTPPAVVETLTKAVRKVMDDPDHRKKLTDYGVAPYYKDPDEYTKIWADLETRMKPVLEKVEAP